MFEPDPQAVGEIYSSLVGRVFVNSGKPMHREAVSIPVPLQTRSSTDNGVAVELTRRSDKAPHTGRLIVNADDWGRDCKTTDRIFECAVLGTISSVSAMVFMADSERAAALAQEQRIDAGLHLNFTTPFSAPNCPAGLLERHCELATCLRRSPFAQVVFHPWLVRSFKYVVAAQLEEFHRLYGAEPERLDGHHHMHLCSNVLLAGLLPSGTFVRRNFSFQPGERSFANRLYRRVVDGVLARRHRLADFFFSLPPFEPPSRLQRIFSLARQFVVEVETHPPNPEEYRFLAGGEILRWAGDCPIVPRFAEGPNGNA